MTHDKRASTRKQILSIVLFSLAISAAIFAMFFWSSYSNLGNQITLSSILRFSLENAFATFVMVFLMSLFIWAIGRLSSRGRVEEAPSYNNNQEIR